jgi:hypothetical protein
MAHKIFRRHVVFIFLILIISGFARSQVVIKERVEIKPNPPPVQRSSTQDVVLFAEDPAPNEGPDQRGKLVALHPCTMTVSGSIVVQPDANGDYPVNDLRIRDIMSNVVASYIRYSGGEPMYGSETSTFSRSCGASGVVLESVGGFQLTQVSRLIGSSAATFQFQGTLYGGYSFTAVATVAAMNDESYDLASVGLFSEDAELTQCHTITYLHTQLRNNMGGQYTGMPCQFPPPPMTLSVEADSDVELIYREQRGKVLTLPVGDLAVQMVWQYRGETAHLPVTVTLNVDGKSQTTTVNLVVVPTELEVTLGKNPIDFGEVTTVTAEIRNGDGTTSPIPPDWTVDYVVNPTDTTGFLYSPDSTEVGWNISGTYSTALYYAKTQPSPPDSSVVEIYVSAREPGGGPGPLARNPQGKGSINNSNAASRGEIQESPIVASEGTKGGKQGHSGTLAGSCGPLNGMARLVVKKEVGLDHFMITFEEDTIAFTETTKIFVQAKDAKDEDIDLDPGSLLGLSLMTNEEYGTFIDKNGDTLKTTPVKLENIPYGELKTGLIRFAAVKKNPGSVVSSRISVELKSDTNKKGDTTIVLLEQTIKIVMAPPYQVRPSIPTENGDTARVGQRKKGFEVKMTRGGKPVADHPFRLSTNYVDTTGGHDHDTTRHVRRSENNSNFGYFLTGRSAKHRWPLDTVTTPEGKFPATYHASIFGDSMRIIVVSNDPQKKVFLWDSITIVEKVDSLELLPEGADYDLIGGTRQHHGPPVNTEDNNHYAADSTIHRLQRLAKTWHSEFSGEPMLQINDISLPFGGKFDVKGKWEGAHDLHRLGKSADIRTELRYYDERGQVHQRTGIPVRSPRSEPFNLPNLEINTRSLLTAHPKFEQICADNKGIAQLHNRNTTNEHYHIEFGN